MLRRGRGNWVPKCVECLKAAAASGDAVDGLEYPELVGWFGYQLATMIRTYLQPATPVVDYGVPHDKLVNQAVCFILRGMGLKGRGHRALLQPGLAGRARESFVLESELAMSNQG